jgi:hypothetical protein
MPDNAVVWQKTPAQYKSSANARTRGAGRRISLLAFGAAGTMVMVQRCGTPDLLSTTDRTWPVIVEPPDLVVAVLPLNCAMRKRRTSFWSAVSNVNMEPSIQPHYRLLTLAVYENPNP